MLKKFSAIFLLLSVANSVFAGSYEEALKKSNNVFLYLYTKDCKTCKVFDSTFNSIQKQNKDYAFVKIDAESTYGSNLMHKFRGRYVPYVVLSDKKNNKSVNVSHSCVMDEICLIRAMKSFKGM